jgi:phage-related holin
MNTGGRDSIMGAFSHYIGSVVSNAWAWLLATVVAIASHYWGAAPEALRAVLEAVLVTTIADTILGVVAAFFCPGRKFSSHHLARVIHKLLVYMMTLLAAFGVDLVVRHVIGAQAVFQLVVGSMIVFRETSSVLEFSAILGVKWPASLKERLDLARKQVEACLDGNTPEATDEDHCVVASAQQQRKDDGTC